MEERGWLSKEGKLYPCGYMEHIPVARDLIKEFYGEQAIDSRPDDYLLDRGWVKIAIISMFDHGYTIIYNDFRNLSEVQIAYIKEFIEDPERCFALVPYCNVREDIYGEDAWEYDSEGFRIK